MQQNRITTAAVGRPLFSGRRGSVLILVIAVLVVLALMGTAFIATARLDRKLIEGSGALGADTASIPPSAKAQVEAALGQVVSGVETLIKEDVVEGGAWLPAGGTLEAFDGRGTGVNADNWLAPRIPLLGGAPGDWPGSSVPPLALLTGTPANDTTPFLAPGPQGVHAEGANPGDRLTPGSQVVIFPDTMAPSYLAGQRRVYPTLDNGTTERIAGDADGDGIADSQLFPVGDIFQVDGLDARIYAAVRIVDHNSAINVDTAYLREADIEMMNGFNTLDPTTWTPGPNKGFFRSNVGLLELGTWNGGPPVITTFADPSPVFGGVNSEEYKLNTYRLGEEPLQATMFFDTNDDGSAEALTFNYASLGELMETNIARRSGQGGFLGTVSVVDGYQAGRFGTGVDGSLRFHNGMVPPGDPNAVERRLIDAAYRSAANFAADNDDRYGFFPADGADAWYQWNFNNTATRQSAVAAALNALPGVVAPTDAISLRPPLRMLLTGNSGESPMPVGTPAGGPAFGAPTALTNVGKASVNTSEFADLWRAFYGVMVSPTDAQLPEQAGGPFASSLRPGNGATGWDAYAQLQLRAALPAINAVALRDGSDDVVVEEVTIANAGGGTTFQVEVFGNNEQPFITEVQVLNAQNDTGAVVPTFVAVELYNPYGPIDLTDWQLVRLDRTTMTLTTIHTFTGNIGSDGYVVVTTGNLNDYATDTTLASGVVPTDADVPAALAAAAADDREIILMRPGGIDGMPVDQVDMHGTATPAPALPLEVVEHRYARPAGTSSSWDFVYPGTYDAAGARRMEWEEPPTTSTVAAVPGANLAAVGATDDLGAGGAETITDITFQLHNMLSGVPATQFPFGGFAREADMLHVPFAGAYIVRDAAGTAILEVNSLPMDLAMTRTDPSGATIPPGEDFALGRFLPYDGTGVPIPEYAWTRDLFDHVSAQMNPRSDRIPNVRGVNTFEITDNDQANVQGRINLNTAPVEVLEMLPLVVDTNGVVSDAGANRAVAQAIVDWRNGTTPGGGPLESVFDLMQVPEVRTMNTTLPPPGAALPASWGKVSDINDPTNGDFEYAYLNVTRLSNLVTVRSDVFTVYVLVQAWQNPGNGFDGSANQPAMLYEQRRAFIIDRSNLADDPGGSPRRLELIVQP
ncbi:MAG: ComEA family DNA-binding protein [Phycisphaerae bacterium]